MRTQMMIVATLCSLTAILATSSARGADVAPKGSADLALVSPSCGGTAESDTAAREQLQQVQRGAQRTPDQLMEQYKRRADFDGDGEITINDLVMLLGAWGNCPPWSELSCVGDINDDYMVDILDLLLLQSFMGQSVEPGVDPVPAE